MAGGVKPEISEYELQRRANIAKNQALLKELQLNAAKQGLGISSKPTTNSHLKSKSSKSHKKKAPVQKAVEESAPRRTSSRLAGLTADSEVAKRKAEEEYVTISEAAKAKRQRVSGALDLTDIVVAGKQWDKSENFLVDVSRGKRFERTFTEKDVRETTDAELRDLREKMSGLELYEGFEPNSKTLNGAD
jgi:WD repeat-containing protein 76